MSCIVPYQKSSSITSNQSSTLSSNLGSVLYAAPEQATSSEYDEKVDIYSLGIILIELFISFSTQSERLVTISNVRKDTSYIKRLDFNDYNVNDLALQMLHTDQKLRLPSTSAIQEHDLFKEISTCNGCEDLKFKIKKLESKQAELERLVYELRKRNNDLEIRQIKIDMGKKVWKSEIYLEISAIYEISYIRKLSKKFNILLNSSF